MVYVIQIFLILLKQVKIIRKKITYNIYCDNEKYFYGIVPAISDFLSQDLCFHYIQLLHIFISKIYWTDWHHDFPKIEVADMSGRNRRVLLNNKDIGQPNTLTMDYKRKRLCWTDYKYLHVACMKLDGKKNIEIISRQVC